MKSNFIKISSISLAFLVLFSTFSFTVEKHYCGDFLMDVSFADNVVDCGMEMEASKKKRNCCIDEVQKIDGQDELQIENVDKLTFKKEQFLIAFLFSYQNLLLTSPPEKYYLKEFPPPEILFNYQVAYQTFII